MGTSASLTPRELLDPREWGRVTGSAFDLFATDAEIQELLVDAIGPEAPRWQLVGYDPTLGPFAFPVDRLRDHVLDKLGRRRSSMFLWSAVELPGLAEVMHRLGETQPHPVVNGLIGLRLSKLIRGPMPEGHSPSTFLLVSAVGALAGDRIIEFRGPRRLFERLKRLARQREACRAVFVAASGLEALTTIGVSSGIVEAVDAGLRLYQHRPAASVARS